MEHRVLFDAKTGRWFKATHPETYGGAPSVSYDLDPLTNRPADHLVLSKATPLQYLARWWLFNETFGDDVRLERVLKVGYGLSLVISQRDISGVAATFEQIEKYFRERDFVPLPRSRYAFYRKLDDVIALDAHPANLVLTASGVVPIDIPTFRGCADRDVAQWLRKAGF